MTLHKRVPPEIFGSILHLCVGFEKPVRDLVTLQLVCWDWHNIIADSSFLWGTINAAEGSRAVHKALQMAKNSLLDLTFIERRSNINQTEFFKQTGERINQWRSLVVESKKWEAALIDLQTRKPPKLDTLHVGSHYRSPGENEVTLFGGAPATGLKNIRLDDVSINPTSLHLSGLKSLHLERIPSASVQEVMAIITRSPDLEILALNLLEGVVLPTQPTTDQPNSASDSRIQLPFLTRLTLCELHLSFLQFLLSTIVAPQLRFLTIDITLDEQPTAQVLPLGLEHLCPILHSITSGAQFYAVTLSAWHFYDITILGLSIVIAFQTRVSMDHFQETLAWLSSLLKFEAASIPLQLNVDDGYPELSYLEWFTHHTNVTEFTLSRDIWLGPGPERIFPSLGQPASSSSPIWLLPQLEVVSIEVVWSEGTSDILDMIKKRYSASTGSAVGLDGAAPKRFREIWFSYGATHAPKPPPDAEFLSEVVRVAEGADVYWEEKKWVDSSDRVSNTDETK